MNISDNLLIKTKNNRHVWRSAAILGILAAVFLSASPVLAHDSGTVEKFGSFLGGLLHPILGLDHFLAMVSVGIVSAQLGGRAIWSVPATFVAVMAVGGVIGFAGPEISFIEAGIAVSVVALGAAIAIERSVPIGLVMIAVGFFALFHGYAHGAEMPSVAQPAGYALGFLSGTAAIHILGVFIGDIPSHYTYGPTVLRTLGGVIGVVGILFLVGIL